jgi:hypothetical protein
LKLYQGSRHENGDVVVVRFADHRVIDRAEALPLRLDLANHSPTGFEWGYGGSGPAQLALAICADVLGDVRGKEVYHFVRERLISQMNTASWVITENQITDLATRFAVVPA